MDGRKQFTFYRSFWEAVQTLPKKDRLPVLEAIISYALDGTVPQGLTTGQSAFFLLVKPNLDAARRKAESGKQGGSKKKANASKPQANSKQTESKKEIENEIENENENEVEIEKENECYKNICGDDGDSARAATESELASVGLLPGEFPGITASVVSGVLDTASRIVGRFCGRSTTPNDCRRVFSLCWRLSRGQMRIDPNALELLRYAFGEAAAAGRASSWPYIEGIMANLAQRGITTLEEAYAYDRDRPDKEDT